MALSFITFNSIARENTESGRVVSIEFRDSGYHAVYFNREFTTMGCDLDDRAIIVADEEGGEGLMMAAKMSFDSFRRTVIRTSGCVVLTPGATITAPKIVRMQVYR